MRNRAIVIVLGQPSGLTATLVSFPQLARDIRVAGRPLGTSKSSSVVSNLDQLSRLVHSLGLEYELVPIDSLGNPL